MLGRLDIEFSDDAGWGLRSIHVSWSEGQTVALTRPQRGDPTAVIQLFALFVHNHLADGRTAISATADSPTALLLRRIKQLLLDSSPVRNRNKWVRELLGPHPLDLLGETGWEGHNALSALVEVTGKRTLVARLNEDYLRPESIRFHRNGNPLTSEALSARLASDGILPPDGSTESLHGDSVDALVRRARELREKGQWSESLETFKRAADLCHDRGRYAEEATCLGSVGAMALTRVPPREARTWIHRSIEAARRAEDRSAEASGLLTLATIEQFQFDLPAARGHIEHAVLIYRDEGKVRLQALAETRLGHLFIRNGDLHLARRSLERAELLAREENDINGVAGALVPQIPLLTAQGDLTRARQCAARAQALFREVESVQGRAIVAIASGDLELDLENVEAAEGHFQEAAALYEELGHKSGRANAGWGIAECMRRQGLTLEARALLSELRDFCSEFENAMGHAAVLWTLARCDLTLGELKLAREEIEEAIEVCRSEHVPTILGNLYVTLGEIEAAREKNDEARAAFLEANRTFGRYRDPLDRARLLMVRAEFERQSDLRTAIRCFHQAAGIYAEVGLEEHERTALARADRTFAELSSDHDGASGTGLRAN